MTTYVLLKIDGPDDPPTPDIAASALENYYSQHGVDITVEGTSVDQLANRILADGSPRVAEALLIAADAIDAVERLR